MVRHIVSWSFDTSLPEEENRNLALRMKKDLEKLPRVIEGIVELKVMIDLLPSSNVNVSLNSLFESEEALNAYQIHPDHKSVSAYAGPLLKDRRCIDYVE